ncbi:M48 family metallopeptidase [Derxia lacustris]|uniref:M48 family metallopeptidase n=1 Tax=Derxia lacustris TaxID=764842 RepID=UPI000A16FCE4|nr:M48 family metallopeptidase [Derxia lacustris]
MPSSAQRAQARLLAQLEARLRRAPRGFGRRFALASLALWAGIALTLAALGGFVLALNLALWRHAGWLERLGAGLALLLALLLARAVLGTLAARLDPPEGIKLRPRHAPALFALVGELCRRLDTRPVHRVVITADFNAALVQSPRFGLFGGHRNTLVLGLPLLCALSRDELAAVVAHELAHITEAMPLGARLYRQRGSFVALRARARARLRDRGGISACIGRKLLDAIAPWYEPRSLVLAREHEIDADLLAARTVGAVTVARALVRIELVEGWMNERFWPDLYAHADLRPVPPFLPHVSMVRLIAKGQRGWSEPGRLVCALARGALPGDSHPGLARRLAALDLPPRPPPPVAPPETAAAALLGSSMRSLAGELDRRWWNEHGRAWRRRHERMRQAAERLAQWRGRPLDSLTPQEQEECAVLLAEQGQRQHAATLFEHVIERARDAARPRYLYGCLLLAGNEPRGLDLLLAAALLAPAMREDCRRAGLRWLAEHADAAVARRWVRQLDRMSRGGRAGPVAPL